MSGVEVGAPDVQTFLTRGLGDASYLIAVGREAVIVDPQRDVERFLDAATAAGRRITHVLETHVHNDYLSGALAVRAATGAEIVAPGRGGYAFPHRGADEGDVVELDGLRIVARATPGHTPEHLSWEVHPAEAGAGAGPAAVLTGGSLLAGSVGRTDLLGPARTAELTAAQFRTLRRLAALPDDVRILPTHGSGSFCSAGPVIRERVTTLGNERLRNPLLMAVDEPAFATGLLGGLGEYPAYYRQMAPINRSGPALLDAGHDRPRPMTPAAVAAAMARGIAVVDARDRRSFAAAHLPGAWNIELDDAFAAYVGWMLPFDAPLVLVLPEPAADAWREAVVQLSRIGFDHVVGHLAGSAEAWVADGRGTASYPVTTAREVAAAQARGEDVGDLLDVRQPIEWRDDGTVPGARRIFVADLPDRLAEVPVDATVTVLCKAGSRAAIAASLLDRAGIPVRLVASGGASAWRSAGSRGAG